ncbi:MAG TPA: hypothetical protein PKL97_02790 [Candidatus Omnitrophota bacterium]|nr:hypothetical protein [Candidatus Omnitrophota bacterium]
MSRKIVSLCLIVVFLFATSGMARAEGEESLTRGAASLIIPGLGQYLNGELNNDTGKLKTGAMILIEIGGIVTTAVVGGVAGYPQVWAGIGILIFNHIWSGTDAYLKAPAGPETSLKEKPVSTR